MIRKLTLLLFSLFFINAQIALPTFHAVHKSHSTSSSSLNDTLTFTNCSATGKTGPTQSQVNSTYTSGNALYNNVTINTQGIQEWTVPATTTYTIAAYGAQGGSGNDVIGGLGAKIQGSFNLTQGAVIKIVVGQQGINYQDGGGGGGGTYVIKSPYNSKASILVIASGGGASNGSSGDSRGHFNGQNGTTDSSGTDTNHWGWLSYINNSGSTAEGGAESGQGGSNGYGGGAGPAGGGAGFFGDGAGMYTEDANAFVNGSQGGYHSSYLADGGFGGGGGGYSQSGYGGGGGGYSGGGGGALSNGTAGGSGYSNHGNGGGGGSYNNGSSPENSTGVREGHGQVIITY